MKLDFNFEVRDSRNRKVQGGAKSAMLDILDTAISNDEKILDKIKYWTRDIAKEGAVEIDVPDAKDLKGVVINSRSTFAFSKNAIKDYIQDRIEVCEIKDNKTDADGKSRRMRNK